MPEHPHEVNKRVARSRSSPRASRSSSARSSARVPAHRHRSRWPNASPRSGPATNGPRCGTSCRRTRAGASPRRLRTGLPCRRDGDRHGDCRIASAGSATEYGSTVTVPTKRPAPASSAPSTFPRRSRPAKRTAPRRAWQPSGSFPGVHPGEALTRHTALPPRASLLARDGTVLAEGAATEPASQSCAETARSSPLGPGADAAVGGVGPIPAAERERLESEGVPATRSSASSGLEKILDARLRGTPGGTLVRGRPRARALARPGRPPRCEPRSRRRSRRRRSKRSAASTAASSRSNPGPARSSASPASASKGYSRPARPSRSSPSSAALEHGVTNAPQQLPGGSYATLDGVKLENANGEVCGGTLVESFANSCNSVFAPLGVKVGAPAAGPHGGKVRLQPPAGRARRRRKHVPARRSSIQGELALGATAIGQGEVQATALEMGLAAATIGERGRRPRPTFALGAPRAVSRRRSQPGSRPRSAR